MSLTLQSSATSTAETITLPSDVLAGDVMVLVQRGKQSSGVAAPVDVTPTGWTDVGAAVNVSVDTFGAGTRVSHKYKIAESSDASATVTGINGTDNNQKVVFVFRPTGAATAVAPQDLAGEITNGTPIPQTANASGGATPLLVLASFGEDGGQQTGISFSPTQDGFVENADIDFYFKIYNASPANVDVSLGDGGARNSLCSFYLEITEEAAGITGIGDAFISPVTAAADGQQTFIGVGAADISAVTAAADGLQTFIGVGAADISPVTADAAGEQTLIGIGAADISVVTAAATGIVGITGVGDAFISPVTAAADGLQTFIGVGAADISPVTADAVGLISFVGVGVADISPVTAAADGQQTFIGVGVADISPVTAAATGLVGVIIGVGDAFISPLTAAADGLQTFIGVGVADISPVTAAASGIVGIIGIGDAFISPVTAAADGLQTFIGVAAADISPVTAAGVGGVGIFGVGDAFISPVTAAADGIIIFIGIGVANISPVTAAATGLVGATTGVGAAFISRVTADAVGFIVVSNLVTVILDQPPSPLLFSEPIANEDGTPTEYFLRQWSLQRKSNASLADSVKAIVALNDAVTTIQAIELIAGTGLTGGGNLSGPDRTFNLEDTTVTPDTYGDANNVAQVTIDQQGRITTATNVAITGGGGGGGGESFAWPTEMDDTFSASAHAFKGTAIKMATGMTITAVAAFLATEAGHSYQAGVYRIDGSDNIDEITGVSAITASPGTFATGIVVFLPLTSPAILVAGSEYVIVFGRTDGTATFTLAISSESIAGALMYYSNVPVIPYDRGIGGTGATVDIDSVNPGIGTLANIISNAVPFGIGFQFSL